MLQIANKFLNKLTDEELPSIGNKSHTPIRNRHANENEPLIFQPANHPKQAYIDGEIWPPTFKPELVRSAKKFVPADTDVFVCTYPKCGTTWIQHICSQLMYNDYGDKFEKELCLTSPMIEKMGADYVETLTHPRLIKTHFSWTNCPKSSKAKYIYAVRNPKDCLVSYYFHNRNFKLYDWADGKFDVFFKLFINGQLGFGDYFDHLKSWLPHINDPNVLFLKYEDMLEDLKGAVLKIGEFLGGRAAQIVADPELLDRVVRESRVDAMMQNQTRFFPESFLRNPSFIRKGVSRDWKNHLSLEQSNLLDRIFSRRLAGSSATFWWREEMRWDDDIESVFSPRLELSTENVDVDENDPNVLALRVINNVKQLRAH